MPEKPSIEEFYAKRKDQANDDGVLFKGVVSEKRWNPEDRSARFVMSTETPDRARDVVKQEGMDLAGFMKNPIALAFHRHTDPIGQWEDVQVVTNGRPRRTEGTLRLHKAGTTAACDEIANLLAVGGLKAVSIGFIPKEIDYIRDEDGVWNGGFVIPQSELLECSVVSIPANPQALMKAAKGDMRLTVDVLEYIADTWCEKTAGGLIVRKDYTDMLAEIRSRKTVSAPAEPFDGGELERGVTGALKIQLDLDEAERQAEDFATRWAKRIRSVFQPPDAKDDDRTPITFTEDDDGVHVVGEWPEKALIAKGGGANTVVVDGDTVTIKTTNVTAEYRRVGESKAAPDLLEVDLIRTYDSASAPAEPAPEPQPKTIKGSRARMIASRVRLKESLRERGLVS